MKVSKAIEMLSKHNNPDDEIIIEWWARDLMEIDGEQIPLDIWDWVADGFEFNEFTYSEMFTQIEEQIYQAIEDNNEGKQQ